ISLQILMAMTILARDFSHKPEIRLQGKRKFTTITIQSASYLERRTMVQKLKQFSKSVRDSRLATYGLPVIFALLAGACLWQVLKPEPTPVEAKPVVSLASAQPQQQTKPIREICVGDRVLAHNPQVSDEERATWEEPKAED